MAYWVPIQERYGIRLTVVNDRVDPQFAFMPLDHDGKIRMDCSSPFAMATLVQMKDRYDIAFGNDPDSDRHGIVTRSVGLLNPNHYLAVAIDYLFTHRPAWSPRLSVGKTAVSSGIIDRVAGDLGRPVVEVPVGFKWFVDGLFSGQFGFAGEESAGASFLRQDGTVWTTDKDGLILGLLAAEITARTGLDPGEHFQSSRPAIWATVLPAHRSGGDCPREVDLEEAVAGAGAGGYVGRRSDSGKADACPGQPGLARWLKGGDGTRLVRRAAVGHGRHVQDLCRSFRDEAHLQRVIDEAREIVAAAFAAAKTA